MRDDRTTSLRVEAWSALKGATWAVFERMEEGAATMGAPAGQMGFIHVLVNAEGPLSARELAERLDVTPASVTGGLDILEAGGYIERRPDPDDRRAVRVTITAAGRALQRRWHDMILKIMEDLMGRFTQEELTTLTELLSRVGPPIYGPPRAYTKLLRHDAAPGAATGDAKKRPAKPRGRSRA